MGTFEVYSHVVATLSSTVVEAIPGNKSEYIATHLGPVGALIYKTIAENQICVSGTLDKVVRSAEMLVNKLQEDEQIFGENVCVTEFCSQCKHNQKQGQTTVPTQDIGVDCKLSEEISAVDGENMVVNDAAEPKTSGDSNKRAGQESASDDSDANNSNMKKSLISSLHGAKGRSLKQSKVNRIKTDPLDENISPARNTYLRNNYKSAKSKYGRAIKVPTKFQAIENENPLSDDEMESENWPETETCPDKAVAKDQENTENMIGIDNAESFATAIEKSEAPEEEGQPKDATQAVPPKDDKKLLKKFYEDKMPYKYFCLLCSFKTKRQTHFEKHSEFHRKNPDVTLLNCDKCSFRTVRASVLFKHKLTHESSVSLLKCSECSYQTLTVAKLEAHMKKCLQRSTEPESCKYCNEYVGENYALHMRLYHPHETPCPAFKPRKRDKKQGLGKTQEFRVFHCSQCDFVTKKKVNLMRHQDNVHSERRPHLCDLCGMSFKRRDTLSAHKETHLDRSKRRLPYSCEKCGKRFRAQVSLRDHQSVHTLERSHQCHICGQMFKTPMVQRRHIQSVHSNPCKHMCSTCKRPFSSKYALKRHERIHDDLNVGLTLADLKTRILTGKVTQGQSHQGEGQYDEGQKVTDAENAIAAVDENITAIETITIPSTDDYEQHLETGTTSHLQPSDEANTATATQVFIQSIVNAQPAGVSIVNMANNIRQMLVAGDTVDIQNLQQGETEVPVEGTSDPDPTSTMYANGSENVASQDMKELYIQAEVCDEPIKVGQSNTVNSIPVELTGIGDSNSTTVELIGGSDPANEAAGTVQFSQEEDQEEQVYDLAMPGTDSLIQLQGDMIAGTGEGQLLELDVVSQDGHTYHIKLDHNIIPSSLFSLATNTSSSSQTE